MSQSGVGSMQGSNEDCLPMEGHTRGGEPQCYQLNRHTDGGTHPQCNPTNGHTYFHRGGTHPQCNPTNGHTNFFLTNVTDETDGQSHILRQHAA